MNFFCDASLSGWGASCDGVQAKRPLDDGGSEEAQDLQDEYLYDRRSGMVRGKISYSFSFAHPRGFQTRLRTRHPDPRQTVRIGNLTFKFLIRFIKFGQQIWTCLFPVGGQQLDGSV